MSRPYLENSPRYVDEKCDVSLLEEELLLKSARGTGAYKMPQTIQRFR